MKNIIFIFITIILIFSGCATPTTKYNNSNEQKEITEEAIRQKKLAVLLYHKYWNRLLNVAHPILAANSAHCENQTNDVMGLFVRNRYNYDEPFRGIITDALNLGEYPTIYTVPKSSPAEKADLRIGDEILSINDHEIEQGVKTSEDIIKVVQEVEANKPVTISYLRGNIKMETDVIPETICFYPVKLALSDEVNAAADGNYIFVTYGMMRFTENDTELATVLTHELAHNIMSHRDAKLKNAKTGGFVGLLLDVTAAAFGVNTQGSFTKMGANKGAQYKSQEFEYEADYVGLYLLARAGYLVDEAPDFWRSMAAEYPGIIEPSLNGSHPSSSERYLSMEKTVQEINDKLANALELVPDIKDKK
jgi:membrane-associated protease RseP (regulator of RpoE activity)